ncbi:interferon-inducible GTPase 5-like [Halichoeres trimaculatus]|uniref:interferon-inducible GTPase 5-like n=1 Tax=Halichoeres trimaculatus TaxID=147232 RepID=UPI003D9F7EBE
MGNRISKKSLEDEVKEALGKNKEALAAAKIQEYLDKEKNIPLNIAITGESGSGKSSFVNAIRGVDDDDEEEAARTGVVETTEVSRAYPHPCFSNVTLWDLPGVGTMKFPAAKYLKLVGFERFDFFIIISADRFRENDVKLGKEIQRMGKNFYFVRSKTDQDIRNEKSRMKKSIRYFSEEKILEQIRENCTQGLQKQGFQCPQVFLVSSHKPHLYDFPDLLRTLERELPEHKKNAFLLAMPNTSLEMIDRKKKAFKSQIKYVATLSAAVAAVPVPGLSAVVDVGLLVTVVTQYVSGLGLSISSLKRLSNYSGVYIEDLKEVIVSPLAATKITPELVLKTMSQTAILPALLIAEEGSKFMLIIGIPLSMALSFTFTYKALNLFLNDLSEDAKRVLQKVLV